MAPVPGPTHLPLSFPGGLSQCPSPVGTACSPLFFIFWFCSGFFGGGEEALLLPHGGVAVTQLCGESCGRERQCLTL
jgi:hypothetical protein